MAIELEDGTIVRSLPEQVDYLTTHNEENEIAIDNLAARLEAAIAGVLHYKGSVKTYADLPADAEIGDVYNVIDTGANYAWTGSEWDELGSSIDISSLVDINSPQTITGVKTFDNGLKTDKIDTDESILAIKVGGNSKVSMEEYQVNFYQKLLPSIDSSLDIGSDSLKFKDIYSSGDIITTRLKSTIGSLRFRPNNLNYDVATLSSSELFTYVKMRPAASGIDLGDSSNLWRDIYSSGTVYIYTRDDYKWNFTTSAAGASFVLRKGTTEVYRFYTGYFAGSGLNLGSSSLQWKDLYLSGNLSDGTNSVNIADLKALIDYAKAQGWIS